MLKRVKLPDCHIFTDGACSGNNLKDVTKRRAAWATVIIGDHAHLSKSGRCDPSTTSVTNNIAELTAIKYALNTIKEHDLRAKSALVEIHTDSEYSLKCLTVHAPRWKRRGWTRPTGGPIKNLPLIKECFQLLQEFGGSVQMSWTKGHSTESTFEAQGNRMADEAARDALK